MMISDLTLPQDLVEEILSRVPATSLRLLRRTCKQWNALYKDQRFREKHHRKAPKQSLLLMLKKEARVCPMSVELQSNLSVAAPSIEFKHALDLKESHSNSQDSIKEVFHCDGLLLCTTVNQRLVVWNPCLGETRWIQGSTRTSNKTHIIRSALGYQNNKSGRTYKILRLWGTYNNIYPNHPTILKFKIYEFSSDSWRVFDDIALDYDIHKNHRVSLKGNTYWIASDRRDKSKFLLSFDFTAERFRRLGPLPVPTTVMLSHVGEEQLSVLQLKPPPSKLELWVTNNIVDTETTLLWSKSFTVDLLIPSISCPVFLTFLLNEEKKVAVCRRGSPRDRNGVVYIIGEDAESFTQSEIPCATTTERGPQFFNFALSLINYVPSLVQIQRGRHQQREEENSWTQISK